MLSFLLLLSSFHFTLLHDIHISYGQSELKGSVYSGKITYYKDDLLKAVGSWYKKDIRSAPAADLEEYQKNYVQNYFRVWERGVQLRMSSLSRKEDETTVMFFFSFTVSPNCSELKIDYRALFDVYNEQLDIMSFTAYGKEFNYIFKPSAPTYVLKK